MANTLTAIIGADTSGFTKSINEAKSVLHQYTEEAKQASEEIKENASVNDAQVASYQRVVKALEKVESGSMTTSQAQKALAAQLQELKIQWANLSEEAKSSDFGASLSNTLSSVESTLKGLSSQVKQANAEMGGLGTQKELPLKAQLKKLQNELTQLTAQYRAMSDAEKQSASGQELLQKMDAIREKAGTLKDTIGDVSEEIKVMASDTPNLDVFNDLIGISGDALSTYSSILARVTGDEKALKDAIATFMTVQSAANLLTKVTNSLQSSSALMLKTRAIQEGAAATAIKIRAMAENKGTIATGAATVAQKLFNAVAKANPYVLLATAVIGVATALFTFASSSDKATQKEKELQREAEETKKRLEEQKHAAETLGGKTGDLVGSFKVLQAQWKSLKTEAEKKEWIKNNQTAFDALNLSVWNVNDAYDVFVKNAPKVIEALKAIAEAEAYQDLYKDAIKKKEVEWNNRHKSQATGDYYATETGSGHEVGITQDEAIKKNEEWVAAGIKADDVEYEKACGQVTSYYKLAKSGIDKINKYRNDQAVKTNKRLEQGYDATINRYGTLMDAANTKAEAAKAQLNSMGGTGTRPGTNGRAMTGGNSGRNSHRGNSGHSGNGSGNGSGSNGKNGDEVAKGSLQDLENQLADLQKKYKDGVLKITPDDYNKQVEALEAKIKAKRIELGLAVEVEAEEGSLQKLNQQISEKESLLALAIDDDSRAAIQKEIDELTEQKRIIELRLKPVIEEKDLVALQDEVANHQLEVQAKLHQQAITPQGDKVERATTNANNLKEELDFNRSIVASYKDQYKAIQERIKAGGALSANEKQFVSIYEEARKQVLLLSDAYKDAYQNAEQLQIKSTFDKKMYQGIKSTISSISTLNDSVKSINDSWKNLSENWDDMSGLEKVTSAISAIIGTIESALSSYEAINEVIKLFGEISEAAAAKRVASNSAEIASDTALTATESANTATKIANDSMENASEIGKLGVKEAGAIAGATASGASLPFPANLAAIAAGIAAVVAAFSMIAGFASGGIVGGNTTVGDYNLIRANKGEMILANHQQANLFRLLNGGAMNQVAGGEVKFKISGKELVGVLSNYNNKTSKVK